MGRLFGTDGVRGLANEKLNCELVYKLGQASARVLSLAQYKPRILVGRDTRLSGDMLEAALIAGICSVGSEARVVGVMPTPAVAYLARHYKADAGIVISASHNSMEYNGIKIFNNQGYKLSDELEEKIESMILDGGETISYPTGINVGRIVRVKNASRHYESFLKGTIDNTLEGLKLVVDCANGSSYRIAPKIFAELGAEVHTIYNDPDGININNLCGSTYPDKLQDHVIETGADLGLAFDGDADRLIAVDENGELVDGDQLLVICGLDMKKRGVLKKDTVVGTIMSNMGFDEAFNKRMQGRKDKCWDRFVLEKMLRKDTTWEESSPAILSSWIITTGDGIITALQLLSILKRRKSFRVGFRYGKVSQVLINARVDEAHKKEYDKDPEILEEIDHRGRQRQG